MKMDTAMYSKLIVYSICFGDENGHAALLGNAAYYGWLCLFLFPARRSDPSGFVLHRRVVVIFVSELENGRLRFLDCHYASVVISFPIP